MCADNGVKIKNKKAERERKEYDYDDNGDDWLEGEDSINAGPRWETNPRLRWTWIVGRDWLCWVRSNPAFVMRPKPSRPDSGRIPFPALMMSGCNWRRAIIGCSSPTDRAQSRYSEHTSGRSYRNRSSSYAGAGSCICCCSTYSLKSSFVFSNNI